MRGGLFWATLVVVATHAAALLPLRTGPLRGEASAAMPSMQVRMVEAARPPSVAPVPAPLPPEPVAVNAGAAEVPPTPGKSHDSPSRPVPPATVAAAPVRSFVVEPPNPARELPPAPDYFSKGQLDPGPAPLSDIEPEYPPAAGALRGSVTLRLLINDKGVVDDASVVRADPPGVFDAAAIDAFKPALFSPGRVLGFPVKSQLTIVVEFTPVQRSDLSARKY